ncbi:OLC1v1017696C1 [Oldenlandia corymbosa var. corymbosa]|uniref:OLC1v1017696C1 n=1 Tax=Oldenlandia corymbosa var. corymbosa TaxID=529605 RepID=A0AAV1E9Z0_OLDCO|nr:OLC1v1017696C1 [Oldenlandia corymbosa var. corymbosa]
MWAKFRNPSIKRGNKKEMKESSHNKNLNVNEEYLGALRTKSYADFFSKAQTLVNQPSSINYCHQKFSDILLEPGQEAISTILESAEFLSRKSDLKALLFNYFDISAEASKICSHLLRSINQIQSNYQLVTQVLDTIDDYSPQQLGFIVSELRRLIFLNNPLAENFNRQDFVDIHDKYSSVLQHLKLKKKHVSRKIKLIKCLNKASGVCAMTACGAVAIGTTILAAHTLVALVMGPAILGFCPLKPLKKKLLSVNVMKCGFLRKIGEQLDVAAKGTYILNRDFDTMSRLVTRLHDEVEHSKAMMQYFLDRREDKHSWQILKELKKSDFGFRKQVEELEEHVYLCLVTINRARSLVVKEIASSNCQGPPYSSSSAK